MKIKEGFILKEVADSYIVVPVGDNLVDFSAMVTVNEVGSFIWQKLSVGSDIEELIKAITLEYEVDQATATTDVNEFIDKLKEINVLE